MGAGIAQVSAEKGLAALKDVSPEGLAKGVAYVAGNLDKKVKRKDGRLQAEHDCFLPSRATTTVTVVTPRRL